MKTVTINGKFEIELDDLADATCHMRQNDLAMEVLDMHSLAVDEGLSNIDLSSEAFEALDKAYSILEVIYG